MASFAALGKRVGELLDAFPPLTAYSINVAGSLLGILAFSGIAFARWPPVMWVLLGAILSLWFFSRPLPVSAFAASVGLVAWASGGTHWSPYYRIDLSPLFLQSAGTGDWIQVGYNLDVNRDFHQRALNTWPLASIA
ncbi:MAG TPA: hypothetical protein VN648_33800 [Candidatus Methylomirabilis sp.]|nr:hypothetical protein [Candidatus Methylomirabilis sp.]